MSIFKRLGQNFANKTAEDAGRMYEWKAYQHEGGNLSFQEYKTLVENNRWGDIEASMGYGDGSRRRGNQLIEDAQAHRDLATRYNQYDNRRDRHNNTALDQQETGVKYRDKGADETKYQQFLVEQGRVSNPKEYSKLMMAAGSGTYGKQAYQEYLQYTRDQECKALCGLTEAEYKAAEYAKKHGR